MCQSENEVFAQGSPIKVLKTLFEVLPFVLFFFLIPGVFNFCSSIWEIKKNQRKDFSLKMKISLREKREEEDGWLTCVLCWITGPHVEKILNTLISSILPAALPGL